MKVQTTLLLVGALLFATPLLAQNTSVDELVAETGLTKQQVRMIIGARTPYPAYRVSYERLRKQLISSVGRARYEELVLELQPAAPENTSTNIG